MGLAGSLPITRLAPNAVFVAEKFIKDVCPFTRVSGDGITPDLAV
jgi:hypothetical protein